MRLIDADKLKVYLQEYLHYGHAIPWVDAQPTAYDVEKVLEEVDEILKAEDIPDCVILDVAAAIYNGGKEVNEN